MRKQLLLSIIVSMSFLNVAIASDYTSEATVKQFDGYVISGQTAQQIATIAKQQSIKAEFDEHSRLTSSFQAEFERFQALQRDDQEEQNIVAKSSQYIGNNDLFDFMSFGSSAIHWFVINGYEYTCKHSSAEGTQTHARNIKKLNDLYMKLKNDKEYIDSFISNSGNFAKQDFNKKMPILLAPFFEQRRNELAQEAKKQETNIKELNCREVIGHKEPGGILGFLTSRPQAVRCKSTKKCKLEVVENNQHILAVGCACGHAMSEHKIKYNKESEGV